MNKMSDEIRKMAGLSLGDFVKAFEQIRDRVEKEDNAKKLFFELGTLGDWLNTFPDPKLRPKAHELSAEIQKDFVKLVKDFVAKVGTELVGK